MKTFVKGLIPLAVMIGAVVILPEMASADDCTLVSSDGTPLTYLPTSPSGGAGSIENLGFGEERVTRLEKTYSVTFECLNNDKVNLSVTLTNLQAPDFANSSADNLDLIGSDSTGVTHKVTVKDVTNSNNSLVTEFMANSNGTLIINPATTGKDLVLNGSDQITFEITSTFVLTGGAEELAEGTYNTQFAVQVTPDVSGASYSNTTEINGLVAKECSVDTRSGFTSSGSPLSYQISTGTVGGEDRVTKLEASDRIVFDCNSSGFSYSISLDTLNAPSFSNAGNLDLVANSGETGVNHEVVIDLKFPAGNPSNSQTTYSKVMTGNIVSGNSANIDLNGDVEIALTSRFQTINSGEELGSGNYETEFTVTVTAQ